MKQRKAIPFLLLLGVFLVAFLMTEGFAQNILPFGTHAHQGDHLNGAQRRFLIRDLKEGLASMGITFEVKREATVEEEKRAVEAAYAGFGGFLNDSQPAVDIVVFTDDNFGDVDDDGNQVNQYYVDQPALMLVLEHQPVPLARSMTDDSTLPATVDSTFVAFVDEKTGETLRAVTFSQD